MLEELERLEVDHRVYRLANLVDFDDMLRRMRLDAEDIGEILEFLGESRDRADAQRLLDAPFAPKPQLAARRIAYTRFSDGSLRVFYSSLESETAELEVLHWYAAAALGSTERVAYYDRFRCRFRGPAMDLRPKVGEWPFLAGDGEEAYASCQALAREAVALDLAGFLTPLKGEPQAPMCRCSVATPSRNPRFWASPHSHGARAARRRSDAPEWRAAVRLGCQIYIDVCSARSGGGAGG